MAIRLVLNTLRRRTPGFQTSPPTPPARETLAQRGRQARIWTKGRVGEPRQSAETNPCALWLLLPVCASSPRGSLFHAAAVALASGVQKLIAERVASEIEQIVKGVDDATIEGPSPSNVQAKARSDQRLLLGLTTARNSLAEWQVSKERGIGGGRQTPLPREIAHHYCCRRCRGGLRRGAGTDGSEEREREEGAASAFFRAHQAPPSARG